jgi:hypothetical protein
MLPIILDSGTPRKTADSLRNAFLIQMNFIGVRQREGNSNGRNDNSKEINRGK